MPVDPRRVKELFAAAIDLPSADRPAFLDRECGPDAELRGRVARLLAAHDAPLSDLERPLAVDATADPDHAATRTGGDEAGATADFPGKDERVGAMLGGKYKLIEAIGEGGMGSVYMAQQTEPVRRLVAVKVIKAGMDSKAVLARFEAERQALAMMDHPNIARVLDAGTTESGRPYFVMELVKGVPITEYCDERKLTPKQRLELFVPVCQAIQHAHQKGVIHRDIKPSNVLIALYDDKPVPKVIDFGVAKAAGQALTDKTLVTGFGAVVGTPEYMSPEQANLNNLDIDTRSDVYSLGVLLYELLTGSTPVDRKSLGKAALLEILRIVREVEAPKPSHKLSSSDALPSISACRGTEPKKLAGLLRSELDWIVMKALEKDRARRYDTANGFAADVQRYLSGEQVQAVPPSLGYRLRKAYRKNKTAVRVATAFALLLCAAVAVSSWLAVKATRAEVVAENNAEAFYGAVVKADESLQQVEQMAAGQRVDVDLIELKTDPRVGLLRLARTLRSFPAAPSPRHYPLQGGGEIALQASPEFLANQKALREFVTAAILVTGQDFAPLLSPITHDGQVVESDHISPDGKSLLTLGTDGVALLWETRTAKPIAILREGTERVVNGGFSTDGKTIFTDDETGIARFWESINGKYRAAIKRRINLFEEAVDIRDTPAVFDRGDEDRPNRVSRSACMKIGRNRLLTQRVVARARRDNPKHVDSYFAGAVELWDTATGQFIARLDRPDSEFTEHEFTKDGKWITTVVDKTTAIVYSADDGTEAARLSHPPGERVRLVAISPSGRCIAVVSELSRRGRFSGRVRVWDRETAKWQDGSLSFTFDDGKYAAIEKCFFLADEHLAVRWHDGGWDGGRTCVYKLCGTTPIAVYAGYVAFDRQQTAAHTGSDHIIRGQDVYDFQSGKRLAPPVGHRFHPKFRQFAIDGRFVLTNIMEIVTGQLIDTVSEKLLPTPGNWLGSIYLQHFAIIDIHRNSKSGYVGLEIRLLPSPIPDIGPELLQLWVQVAVRGELGPEGEFVPWNEVTWEKKRQELAAIPPPNPDLPFPGYVATDKLHWLRAEYHAAPEKDKLGLVTELLRRAEEFGDKNEAVRWRTERAKYIRELAPPPKAVK